ncbi:unnamed protein product [Thelazia callipaeda]|uniref:SAP domain-containing protein n=1 Tax=Thelazia callipaeda TaxID=103827 RepID=A0A0N5D442_THECL|nr:unnamed protein product [Thelazia callipaeda]
MCDSKDKVVSTESESSVTFPENLHDKGSQTNVVSSDTEKAEKPEKQELKLLRKGLLDGPVIMDGKRQRHAVDRLHINPSHSLDSKKSSVRIVGSGTCLGDIEFVRAGISKARNDTLKRLHNMCYGSPGTTTSRRRNLKKFNGFAFDEKSVDFEKKKIKAMKITNNELTAVARILGLGKNYTKNALVMSILRFLQKPEDKGRKFMSSKRQKRSRKSSGKITRKKLIGKGDEKNVLTVKKLSLKDSSKDAVANRSSFNLDIDAVEIKKSTSSNAKETKLEASESESKTKVESSKDTKESESRTVQYSEKMEISDSSFASAPETSVTEKQQSWGIGGPSNEEVEAAISNTLNSTDLSNCTMNQMYERATPNMLPIVIRCEIKDVIFSRIPDFYYHHCNYLANAYCSQAFQIAERFPNLDMATYKSAIKNRVKAVLEKLDEP